MDSNISPQPAAEQPQPTESSEAVKKPEAMQAPAAESAPSVPQSASVSGPQPVALPTIPADPVVAPAAVPPAPASAGPALADDVDVIEKEWVDKAQEIIEQTKSDPYQEEEQIEDLQLDYLKKRYGKDIEKETS